MDQSIYNQISKEREIMINNFTLKPKLCKFHSLPEAFICIDGQCQFQSLLCSNCVKTSHPHYHHIYKIQDFMQYYQNIIIQSKERFEKSKSIIHVAALVKNKKQEIEQKQLQILEYTMKRLSEEKKALFETLDSLEKAYTAREASFKKNLDERMEIMCYLSTYAESKELLQLKLFCSSQWGIVNLKNNLADLEKLNKEYAHRNVDALTEIIVREIDKKYEQTFMNSLRSYVFSYFMIPPPLKLQFPLEVNNETRIKLNSQRSESERTPTIKKNQSMEVIPRIPSSPSNRKIRLSRVS